MVVTAVNPAGSNIAREPGKHDSEGVTNTFLAEQPASHDRNTGLALPNQYGDPRPRIALVVWTLVRAHGCKTIVQRAVGRNEERSYKRKSARWRIFLLSATEPDTPRGSVRRQP